MCKLTWLTPPTAKHGRIQSRLKSTPRNRAALHLPTRAFISHHTPYSDVPIIAVKNEKQMKKTHFILTGLSFLRPMMKPSKASMQEME